MARSKGQSDKTSMTRIQFKDIAAMMIQAIPNLTSAQAEQIIDRTDDLVIGVKRVFLALLEEEMLKRRARRNITSTETVTIDMPVAHTPQPPYDDCTLEIDVEEPTGSLTLSLYDFFVSDGEMVKGSMMVARTKKKHKLLGERHARALLAQAHLIPESWQIYLLVFPGTVWHRPNGDCLVFCLFYSDGYWELGWNKLGSNWYGQDRVVVLAPTA